MPIGRLLTAGLALLCFHACSVTNDLDGLTENVAGAAGAEAGVEAGPVCEPGNCAGCVGCEAFCGCATTTAAAKDQCLKVSCTVDAGADGASGGNGGSDAGGGSGGTGASASGGGSGTGGAGSFGGSGGISGACQSCSLSNCGSEGNSCAAEAECNAILACFAACANGNATCRNACVPDAGAPKFQTLLDCMAANCASVCNL